MLILYPSTLFMDCDVILSQERTTQTDLLAMPMYALETIPLITKLKQQVPQVNQVWYADDSAGSNEISWLNWHCYQNVEMPVYLSIIIAAYSWAVFSVKGFP